jgi:hypothetical protein
MRWKKFRLAGIYTEDLCGGVQCKNWTIYCVGYSQNGLKPFLCYVKLRYATKVIE